MDKKLLKTLCNKLCISFGVHCNECPFLQAREELGVDTCETFIDNHPKEVAISLARFIAGDAALNKPENKKDAAPETRQEILQAAERCVCGDREKDYGDAADNFRTVGLLWSAYLLASHPVLADAFSETSVAAADVAAMLGLLKLARAAANPARMDNWVDLAGYAALGGEISKKEAE